jgi:hypothetical protein
VNIQTVKTSIDTWTRSLKGDIMDTNKDFFHEATVNTRNNLHEELGLMFQVEVQTTKAEIRVNQERMESSTHSLKKSRTGPRAEDEQEPAHAWRSHLSLMGLHHGPCSRLQQSTTAGCTKRNPHT